jgi:uncharacterized sulfatase
MRTIWAAVSVFAVMVIGSVVHAADTPARKLNVLFIVCDDQNNHLGCYGDTIVKTPNIDALAARGMRFDRAYCQYPVCNPSRTSFLSGLRPETTHVVDQMTLLRAQRDKDVVYLPEHFKNNGYFIAGIGKVEHGGHHEIKWDVADDFKGAGAADEEEAGDRPAGRRPRAASRPVRTPTKRQQNLLSYEVKRATEDGDPENVDDQIAAKVVKLLEEHAAGDKPFFIVAGFHKPHVPHVAPKKFFDLYPLEKMPLTVVPPGDEKDIPPAALASQRNYQPAMSDERKRDIIAAYYACVSYVDDRIGQVTTAMDHLKLWDNTVVVYIGDHGWHFGEHNWWAKASLFEESCRAPLIVASPGVKSQSSCPRVVEFLDIASTLVELCGLPAMPQGQGKSFAPLLSDAQRPWDHAAFTALGERGRTVRDERYRYTEWQGGKAGAELYDHEADPGEITNLAKDPAHAQVVARMRTLLRSVPTTRP